MIGLNCDMGEGCGNDAALMPFMAAANIACGFHAGDEQTMGQTLRLAKQYGVSVGAHPSFPDREHFGRIPMTWTAPDVHDWVVQQVRLLQKLAAAEGQKVSHVKPHGALYNAAAVDRNLAAAIAAAVKECGEHLVLFGLSGSELIRAGKSAGLQTKSEVFADRTYQDDGSLTPRTSAGALITHAQQAVLQVLQMVRQQSVTTVSGKWIPVVAETVCIHGDASTAPELAKAVHVALQNLRDAPKHPG